MIKTFTFVLGFTLLIVGILGAATVGHDHEFIIFGVNAAHNVVHIVSGIAAIAAALAGARLAQIFCVAFGVVYGLVAVVGLLNLSGPVSMMNLNNADDFLHLAIAAACLYFGLSKKRLEVRTH